MNKIKCLRCGKEFEPKGIGKYNEKKFCKEICRNRYNACKKYKILRDIPEYREKRRKQFKEWYKLNKDKQKENVLRNYRNNKPRWNERRFVDNHRKDIMKFINPLCSCGKVTKIIFHLKFGNRPLLKSGMGENNNLELIKKYTEDNLIGVCSRFCMKKLMRKE